MRHKDNVIYYIPAISVLMVNNSFICKVFHMGNKIPNMGKINFNIDPVFNCFDEN